MSWKHRHKQVLKRIKKNNICLNVWKRPHPLLPQKVRKADRELVSKSLRLLMFGSRHRLWFSIQFRQQLPWSLATSLPRLRWLTETWRQKMISPTFLKSLMDSSANSLSIEFAFFPLLGWKTVRQTQWNSLTLILHYISLLLPLCGVFPPFFL